MRLVSHKNAVFTLTLCCYTTMLLTNIGLPALYALRAKFLHPAFVIALSFMQFWLSLNFVISIRRAQISNPGYISLEYASKADTGAERPLSYCHICLTNRPLFAHHCRKCNKCVALFDHHCKFLDACIGGNNFGIYVKIYLTGSAWGIIGFITNKILVKFDGITFWRSLGALGSFTGAFQYFRGFCKLCLPRILTGIPPIDRARDEVYKSHQRVKITQEELGGGFLMYIFNPFVICGEL